MKLTAILILVACLQVSARGYTQESVTLNEKNADLASVLKKITKQTGVHFVHRDEWLKDAKPVNISVKNRDLASVLQILFQAQPALTYERVSAEMVAVKYKQEQEKKNDSNNINSPPIDIHGRVVNEKGDPVEGVTVTVKGTKTATSTNFNGEFSLATVDPDATLIFTSVNMETFELAISGQKDLTIKLRTKVTSLGDVTVTNVRTGYQTLSPNEVTGSVDVISKQKLDQRIAPDVISKLEGITNGLVFNKTNDGRTQLRIRGESTIFGFTEPLIIVDNFPYAGDINSLNPNDIESVTVLKDAGAASIWGVQAGNGVIVITTKRGKIYQPIRVELNTNFTIGEKPDLFYSPQINPTDFIDHEIFLFGKGYYNSALSSANKAAVSPIVEILNNRKLGIISAGDSATQIDALRSRDLRTQLLDHFYQKPVHQQYQVNVSGGTAKSSYYFSAGYDKALFSLIGNSNRRFTFNNQSTFRPVENLELNAGIVFTESILDINGTESIPNVYPYMRLVDDQGNQLPVPQHRAVFEDTIVNRGFYNWKYFPLQERELGQTNSNTYDTRLVAGAKYTVLEGLSVDISYQYQRYLSKRRAFTSEKSYTIRNNYNRFAIVNNGNLTGTNYPLGGMIDFTNNEQSAHFGRASLNYNRSWDKHAIAAIAGYEAREVTSESNGSRYYGFDDDNGSFVVPNLFTTYTTYPTGSATIDAPSATLQYGGTTDRFRSFFTNAAYAFKDRYRVSGSLRYDGSNYFGVETNKKTVPLWSVGGKWDINKESFYHLDKLFPVLALRATYGYNGNMTRTVSAVTTFQYWSTSLLTGLPYAGINNAPNPELRWERISMFNVGLDFAISKSRLFGSIEYFKRNGSDLLGDAPIDPTTGFSTMRGNFSGMKAKGVDIRLGSNIIDKSVNWTVTALLNYVNEMVTDYDAPTPPSSYFVAYSSVRPIVGRPLYALYSYRWAGLEPATGNPRVYLGDTINKAYTSQTLNDLKPDDLVYSGRYNPPVTGSLMNSLSWKGLNLTFNVMFKLGHYFRRNSISYSLLMSGWEAGHADYARRWKQPGDEAFTNVPSFVYPVPSSTRDNFYNYADILVEKADHIRLQFVNLSYTIDKKQFARLPIKSVRVFLYANNVGILWRANDLGIDPEYPYVKYPPTRSWSFGIQAGF